MNKFLITILIPSMLLLSGCSRGLFSVYQLDIQQGNALEPEDVARIKPGLTRKEVQAILGYPVIDPLFNPQRWDYVYYRKRPDTPVETRHLSVWFDGDVVERIDNKAAEQNKK